MKRTAKIFALSMLLLVLLIIVIPLPVTHEYYTEIETYQREYKYDADVESYVGSTPFSRYYIVNGTVKNLENISGEFEVFARVGRFVEGKFEIYDSRSLKIFLEPNETKEFELYLYTSLSVPVCGATADIDPPTITDTRTITKSRPIYKSLAQLIYEKLIGK